MKNIKVRTARSATLHLQLPQRESELSGERQADDRARSASID
jgi:hypothetical protein